MLKLC